LQVIIGTGFASFADDRDLLLGEIGDTEAIERDSIVSGFSCLAAEEEELDHRRSPNLRDPRHYIHGRRQTLAVEDELWGELLLVMVGLECRRGFPNCRAGLGSSGRIVELPRREDVLDPGYERHSRDPDDAGDWANPAG
jgi:hypothetical protein